MRPNSVYQGPRFDDQYNITVRITEPLHRLMIENMNKKNLNRTDWLRQAIEEKLEREERIAREAQKPKQSNLHPARV